jgi:hypothetical protein
MPQVYYDVRSVAVPIVADLSPWDSFRVLWGRAHRFGQNHPTIVAVCGIGLDSHLVSVQFVAREENRFQLKRVAKHDNVRDRARLKPPALRVSD